MARKIVWRFTTHVPDVGLVEAGEVVTKAGFEALEANALTEQTYTVEIFAGKAPTVKEEPPTEEKPPKKAEKTPKKK